MWEREYTHPKPVNLNSTSLSLDHGGLQIEASGSRWVIWPKFLDGDEMRVGFWVGGDIDLRTLEEVIPLVVAAELEALAADLRAYAATAEVCERIEAGEPIHAIRDDLDARGNQQ